MSVPDYTTEDEPVNHDEAYQFACYKRANSNLARAYIELHQRFVQPEAVDIIESEARDTDHAHAVMWRKHVQMLRRQHQPHVVQELIDAVKRQVELDRTTPQSQPTEITPDAVSVSEEKLKERSQPQEERHG